MPLDTLKKQCNTIAENAFVATFCGQSDVNNIAKKFADIWSEQFSLAIQKYVSMCIGLPTGGPVQPANTKTLEQDVKKAAYNALKNTFLGQDDKNDIATKFSNGTKQIPPIVQSYMSTVMTTPAAPPAVPVSPGGPLIASSSSMCAPVFMSSGQQMWKNTFLGENDEMSIATLFANIFQQISLEIGNYVLTCSSAPGGGPLIAS